MNIFISMLVVLGIMAEPVIIENNSPPLNKQDILYIWQYMKKEIGAPTELMMPPLVIDWEVPKIARMGFQYPTAEYPNRMQISISPRVIDLENHQLVLWGIGHELAHYLFTVREVEYDPTRLYYEPKPQHCDPEYQELTRKIADLIWSIWHDETQHGIMYQEVEKSCILHPDQ